MGTIDVFCTFATQLGLSNEIIYDKIIMMRSNLLTIRNVQQSIFWYCGKLMKLNKFDWLDPTAGLFHLQMNLLTIMFDKLWGKSGNIASLSQFSRVLKRLKVSRDIKNFHAYNTFFKHLVDVHVIALLMEKSGQNSIDEFQVWIARSDLSNAIKQAQEQYLRPFYIQFVRTNARKKTEYEVIATFSNRKEEWFGSIEERNTPEPEPNWDDIKREL